ncbi:MAG: hypothetical protein J5725_01825 [Bacteroidales bacterium]|nr:hypothetical protein [Bacteroidales bacterium]
MGRTISLTLGDKTYTLEFNRKTLLKASDTQDKMSASETASERYEILTELVYDALLKNHPDITLEEAGKIFDSIDDLEGFVKALLTVMEDSVNALKEIKGNARWEVK